MGKVHRGGRASAALTRLVIETYGPICHLQLPGCTRRATTKDHIIPYHQGGTNDLSNFRPACKSCNSKRQNTNMGSRVKIITGPPASGKSTYIATHAGPHDVIIDLDRIAVALMHPEIATTHSYPDYIKHIAQAARRAAITTATRMRARVTVWIIHSRPSPDKLTEYRRYGWEVVTLDPGRETVTRRAMTERPADSMDGVEAWYSQHPETTNNNSAAPSRRW
ncbi:HNH endonuclease [Nesterenkonia halotolerans]|uniref:HNH endonuclease n=1 Tax=Nesterenkonia halotolerans TaxID=225325 RepID=UPI003EE4BDA2